MPKLPIVSGTDAVRALERVGFNVVRQRGSHMVLRSIALNKSDLTCARLAFWGPKP
jgi:predicted RNA binding protein YcfA (HicA-like mRNA interferase family)